MHHLFDFSDTENKLRGNFYTVNRGLFWLNYKLESGQHVSLRYLDFYP